MWNIVWVILFVVVARAQPKYKFCAPVDTVPDTACLALQRGDSEVLCLSVADSAECAIRLAQGEADFGIFDAEELLLAYKFYPDNIIPILELRHRDKQLDAFEFQTVAVVRADLPQKIDNPGNFDHLKNNGLCHPGFSKSQWWNDYILKYFEKRINRPRCQEDVSVIENELKNLRDFFGKACRPGEWVADSELDQKLKKDYPELCALCDDKVNCKYNNNQNHGHYGAMDCLANRRGKVAYVALSYVQDYFKTNETFEFLCADGNRLPLSSPTPCSWIKQPWNAVVARKELADVLRTKLSEWLDSQMLATSWKVTLREIIQQNGIPFNITERSLTAYLSKGRDIDLANAETCDRTARWCTIGDLETKKCEWVARAAIALGIEPRISCLKTNSTFQCFRDIAEKRADIMAIDSNYGHLARTVYGLSTVLYCETEVDKNSVIVAVVREPKDNNYPITSFHDLKDKNACFSEYGGIGWLSFINTMRTNGIISSRSCDYPLLVSRLLSGACTPGIKDGDHLRTNVPDAVSSKLCSACVHKNNTSCAVNETNLYYGDKGALRCLTDEAGDMAIVETGNILNETIDKNNMYRVLCKNGSLAQYPGFNFDDICALSITIDSEVIGRKNDLATSERDITLALLKIEDWLGYRVNALRPIHIYGPFNGTKNLLFKDSTSGLVSKSSTKSSVEAYRNLFRHIDACSNGIFTTTANFIFVALVTLYHFLFNHTQY